jgi:hypothetical protein
MPITPSLKLGRIAGIEVGVHYSWLFFAALISWSLAGGYFPQTHPGWSVATYWLAGAIAALALFLCVLLHELTDLSNHWWREIEAFFATHKLLEDKDVQVRGWRDGAAWQAIERCRAADAQARQQRCKSTQPPPLPASLAAAGRHGEEP